MTESQWLKLALWFVCVATFVGVIFGNKAAGIILFSILIMLVIVSVITFLGFLASKLVN